MGCEKRHETGDGTTLNATDNISKPSGILLQRPWDRWAFLFLMALVGSLCLAQESPVPAEATSEAIVYVIPIHKEIFKGLIHPVERGIEEAKKAGAKVILFEFNTPGGAVDTALTLKNIILDASKESSIQTAAFVNREAISAGALLALSTEKIFMREGSTIGGAAPILATGEEMGETMEEKMVSVLAAEFRAAAKVNGHDPELAEAMVDRDKEIPGVIEKGKLLSLDAERAIELGLAAGKAETIDQVVGLLGYPDARIIRVEQNWAETLARFITNPAIAGILLMIALGGIYMEVKTPGFGVPGTVGILAFILVFWGHHIAGLAGFEVLLIFILGLILLGIELFVTPGFGFLGTLGLACIFGSMLFMLSERMPVVDKYFRLEDLAQPLLVLISSIAGAFILSGILLAFLPTTRAFDHLVLADSTSKEEGFVGTEEKPAGMVGQEGVTISDLRPAGIAQFGKDRLDVVTQGGFIDAGRRVAIVRVAGRQVIVKEVKV